jgi:protoheme IX farnesyltransferase
MFFDLVKIKISLLATLSTATGYLLGAGKITHQILVPAAAVFLLACGSCALNQYQDREIDRLMERTRSRPIPSGKLSPDAALWISMGLIFSGSLILLYGTDVLALALGLFAFLWYSFIYTPFKQRTAFAVVPGALVGAIPPILGWTSGGGALLDPRIWGVALFFFIWQIPHFWLLLLDFSKDYERAGLPCITKIFSTEQIKRIVFVWLLSTGVSSLAIPLFGFFNSFSIRLFLMSAACWFFWNAIIFLRSHPEEASLRATFTKLNISAVLIISLLSLDRLLGP